MSWKNILVLTLLAFIIGIQNGQAQEKRIKFSIHTSLGELNGELFNETPMHRDNFIKLATEKFFDSLLY